jgi:hypothetical protein
LNASYNYDANGNVLSDGVRNYVYTSFNLPSTITKRIKGVRLEFISPPTPLALLHLPYREP